jgi:predicted amidohydrolase
MRAVLAQLEPVIGDVAANVAAVEETVAAHSAVDLVAFPELFLSGYDLETVAGLAVALDGPEVARMSAVANSSATNIVIGLAELTDGRPANTAMLIDRRGRVAGVYRKTHLWGAEADAFTPGADLEPITLGDRRLGLMICFDVEFPEVARTLVARGADLLVTIAANMAPYGPDHELAAQARALENGVPHLYVNRVGIEAGLEFVGKSRGVNTWGRTVGVALDQPCALEVLVGEPGAVDDRLDYARQLRPELYELGARLQA